MHRDTLEEGCASMPEWAQHLPLVGGFAGHHLMQQYAKAAQQLFSLQRLHTV